jgi:hypothetical protein
MLIFLARGLSCVLSSCNEGEKNTSLNDNLTMSYATQHINKNTGRMWMTKDHSDLEIISLLVIDTIIYNQNKIISIFNIKSIERKSDVKTEKQITNINANVHTP